MKSKEMLNVQTTCDLKHRYASDIHELLSQVLPEKMFFSDTTFDEKRVFFHESLPLVRWVEEGSTLHVILLCKHRTGVSSFFYDMISRWLSPDKQINIDLFFSTDFFLESAGKVPLTISHIALNVDSETHLNQIRAARSTVETELRLGAASHYHARRILEFKGLSPNGKTAMIQEKIGSLIQSRSQDYDKSIFSQMQRFLVTCKDEFKNNRDYHHISRIISIFYLIRKLLKQKITAFPKKRHFVLKFLKTKLSLFEKEKNVLGVLVGLNFLSEHEVFEKKHLLNAIKTYIPDAKAIEDSFIVDKSQGSALQTVYLEIEKENGTDFSHEEIQTLRASMPEHLKGHIEYLMHPIFMPRNDEEVLRNIMHLSKQLKFVQDIPQVMITFDEQKALELSFTVILLRVLKPKMTPIREKLKELEGDMRLQIERVKKVGTLRRKYPKEASVFRMHIPSQNYLRSNHSVDLYRAREDVLKMVQGAFEEVRDFNGGMIYKQNEVFKALKKSLGKTYTENEYLVEKFFFALTPIEMRSIISAEYLKILFLMLLQSIKKKGAFHRNADWFYKQDAKKVALVLPVQDPLQKSRILDAVSNQQFASHELLSFSIEGEHPTLGFLLLSDDKERQEHFIRSISRFLEL